MAWTNVEDCVEAEPPRPSVVLQQAEEQAMQIAKLLRSCQVQLENRVGKASVTDAINSADTIAALAASGRKGIADHANIVMFRVEELLDILQCEMTCMFTKTE